MYHKLSESTFKIKGSMALPTHGQKELEHTLDLEAACGIAPLQH